MGLGWVKVALEGGFGWFSWLEAGLLLVWDWVKGGLGFVWVGVGLWVWGARRVCRAEGGLQCCEAHKKRMEELPQLPCPWPGLEFRV